MTLASRLGTMQGRLVPSSTGELQSGPGARWADEFSIASGLGLTHIELMAERSPDRGNPIWSAPGRRAIRDVVTVAGVDAPSLCMNETLATRFEGTEAGEALACRLLPVISELPIRIVVLPLDEASALEALDWQRAAESVRTFTHRLDDTGITLALEINASAETCRRFLDLVDVGGVGLCYDVGNAAALGFAPATELRALGTRVVHVHAKDKDEAGVNVQLGRGMVPFRDVIAALHSIRFDGLVTMEATRGDDPIASAEANRAFLLALDSPDPT